MNLNTIWSTLMEAIEPLSDLALERADAELNPEPGWLTWLWAICLFDLEPFSIAAYMRIRPYGSARVNEARFASAFKQGMLTVNSQNEYLLTEKGRYFVNKFFQVAKASIAHLQPIPTAELQKIADYGKRLVEASLAALEPPSKFGMTSYYKNVYPGKDTQLPRLILHYVATLSQYRDASHLAAGQDNNLAGYAWSAFTSIWRQEADALDALHKEMGTSIFTREEILEVIHNLKQRGWIEEESGKYQTTTEGDKIRQEAENETNHLFFIPWACLKETELEELLALSVQLRDGLNNSTK